MRNVLPGHGPVSPEKESTIRSRASLSLIFACALVGATIALPASADTEAELDAAEQQLEGARAELDRINRLWQDAEADLARSQDAAEAAQPRIDTLTADLATIQRELDLRAASLFIAGGNPQALALLTSESVGDAVDRLEFASAVAEGDSDLANQVSVETQELAWQQDQLAEAIESAATEPRSEPRGAAGRRSKPSSLDSPRGSASSRTSSRRSRRRPPAAASVARRGRDGGAPAAVGRSRACLGHRVDPDLPRERSRTRSSTPSATPVRAVAPTRGST